MCGAVNYPPQVAGKTKLKYTVKGWQDARVVMCVQEYFYILCKRYICGKCKGGFSPLSPGCLNKLPAHIQSQIPARILTDSNYKSGKLISHKLWDTMCAYVGHNIMLTTLAKIVNQHYHEGFWDRLTRFMQRRLADQQPAPATIDKYFTGKPSVRPPAAASTQVTNKNDDALAKVESAGAKVFRSAVNQDKLPQDVLSIFGQYDDEYGFNGQNVLGDWLNSMFKGWFGAKLRRMQHIHMQGIGAQIAAFDWNVVCAQRLLVPPGQPPLGVLAIAGNEWNQVCMAVFTQQMDSYQELTRYHIPAFFARCVELGQRANNKEKVIPVLNYYDNVRAAQGMMAVAMPSVGKHLNDLIHGQMRITKEMSNIPAKKAAIMALSNACFKADPAGKDKVTADFMKKAAEKKAADTDADKSEEHARARLLDKKAQWWRSRTDAKVPPPSELASRMFLWLVDHCLIIDDASAVPLFTPKAVHAAVLQIKNVFEGHFSDPPLPLHTPYDIAPLEALTFDLPGHEGVTRSGRGTNIVENVNLQVERAMSYIAGPQLVEARLLGALTYIDVKAGIKNKGNPDRHLFHVMRMKVLEGLAETSQMYGQLHLDIM